MPDDLELLEAEAAATKAALDAATAEQRRCFEAHEAAASAVRLALFQRKRREPTA